MRFHWFLILALISTSRLATTQTTNGIVEIQPIDSLGGIVKLADAYLYSSDGKEIAHTAGTGTLRLQVPYGRYRLVVLSPGSKRSELLLKVDSGKLFVLVGVVPRFGDSSQDSDGLIITGELEGLPKDHSGITVRLVGLHLNVVRDGEVNAAGTFAFANLDMGSYAVLVIMGNQVVGSSTVVLDPAHKRAEIHVPLRGH